MQTAIVLNLASHGAMATSTGTKAGRILLHSVLLCGTLSKLARQSEGGRDLGSVRPCKGATRAWPEIKCFRGNLETVPPPPTGSHLWEQQSQSSFLIIFHLAVMCRHG